MGEAASEFEDFIADLHATDIERANGKGKQFETEAYYKKAIGLQLLGLLGKDPGHVWNTIHIKNYDDAPWRDPSCSARTWCRVVILECSSEAS